MLLTAVLLAYGITCVAPKEFMLHDGRYTWILLSAEKSAGPQSGKFFRRIPKKTPET